jgi:cephalosporin-C deacetylase-like acetyl esterase
VKLVFDYDNKADLKVRKIGVEKRGDVTIRDITFAGVPGRDDVKAYLVEPESSGPFAGILWVHWLGEEKANRTQHLEEAVALAPKGAVSLLVDAMWSAPDWYGKRVPEQDYDNSIRQVIELRRAMDLLTAQPNVDKARIGFVGHDYGGMYGTLMAGVDPRAKTYVFLAVTPSLSDWAFFAAQPKSKVEYIRQNAVFELTEYIRQVQNASVFFQFAENDVYVSRTGAAVYFHAANEPKQRKIYDTDHSMHLPEVEADRDAWLVKELNLSAGANALSYQQIAAHK